jgi:hypothetical protein
MEFEMTKFSIIALTAMLAVAGVSAPAVAATAASSGNVPFCSSGNDSDALNRQQESLATQLQLSTKPGSSIEVWNCCFKVMSTEGGKTNVAFYDPDSLALVATI